MWKGKHRLAKTEDSRSRLQPSKMYFIETQTSFGDVFSRLLANSPVICSSVVPEHCIRVALRGIVNIGVIQQFLYSQKDLFDSNTRLPSLLFVQDRQTDGARWIDIRMEQRRRKFAFWRLGRVILWEAHDELVDASFPWRCFLPWYSNLPFKKIL